MPSALFVCVGSKVDVVPAELTGLSISFVTVACPEMLAMYGAAF
jgi:hypothetical protein